MVLRINIADAKTDGICKLVLTFHKISKEIGDNGEVGGVVFDINEFKSSSSSGTNTPVTTTAPSGGSNHKRSKSNVQPQVRLVCEKDDLLAVSVFHTQGETFAAVKNYVKQVLAEFTRIHGKEVLELRPTFDAMADAAANNKPPASAGMRPEAILFRFEKFAASVESLREKGGL